MTHDTTADGHEITLGMFVWTTDLRTVQIVRAEEFGPGWYRTTGGTFNGERMSVRGPFGGPDASADTVGERA